MYAGLGAYEVVRLSDMEQLRLVGACRFTHPSQKWLN